MDNPVKRFFKHQNLTTETISVHTGFYGAFSHAFTNAFCMKEKKNYQVVLNIFVLNTYICPGNPEYLFRKDNETGKTHLDDILDKVKALLRQYPRYRIFFTGHSLGGALATLCGFYTACNDKVWKLTQKKPITIISIASPFVGNWKFRDAFLHLERIERLQHLRISNHDDMVTHLPFIAPKAPSIIPMVSKVKGAANLYKHVGIRLQLVASPQKETGKSFHLSYPACLDVESGGLEQMQQSLREGQSFAKACFLFLINKIQTYHGCDLYEQRMENCQYDLSQVTLDQLYSDKTIVGDILNSDYQPSPRHSNKLDDTSITPSFSFVTRKISSRSFASTS